MGRKALKDMDFQELQDECRDRDIPYKDASSADELRKRLVGEQKAKE